MDPECLLHYSDKSVTRLYPESSPHPHPTILISILILSSHLAHVWVCVVVPFFQVFWHKFRTYFSFNPCLLHAPSIWSYCFNHPYIIWWSALIWKLNVMQHFHHSIIFPLSGLYILLSILFYLLLLNCSFVCSNICILDRKWDRDFSSALIHTDNGAYFQNPYPIRHLLQRKSDLHVITVHLHLVPR
jgi:hypothetical protein